MPVSLSFLFNAPQTITCLTPRCVTAYASAARLDPSSPLKLFAMLRCKVELSYNSCDWFASTPFEGTGTAVSLTAGPRELEVERR